MNGLFTPSCALTLGSQRWTTQALRVELALEAAPGINVLRAVLPSAAPFSASAGDPAELTLNDGQNDTRSFSGSIDSIRHTDTEISITALDAGGALARVRPAATYEHVTPGTLIRTLASDAGVQTGALENGSELSFYVAHPGLTAWDHIHRVSAWLGALVIVSASNKVESAVVQPTQADVSLRYGREILGLDRTGRAAPVQSFTVAGESGAGSAAGPDARRPSTDFYNGNRPDGPSATARWEWQPALRTVSTAASAGAARARAYAAFRDTGKVTAILQPALRPGVVLEIQGAPAGLPAGPMWIWRVQHTLTADGAITTAWLASGGQAGSVQALLGSAASAAGSFF
jgi:hypothetical protein